MFRLFIYAAFFQFALFSTNLSADLIVWGAATDTTAVTDISTSGTLVSAFNGGAGTPTANGVTFTAANVLTGSGVSSGMLAGGNTGDAGFNTLLDQVDFGGGGGLISIDLGTFTLGNSYEVQIFFTDQRATTNDRVMQFGSNDGTGAGGTVNLEGDTGSDTSATPFGQFAIGTFVGDGNDPDLTLDAQGFGNAHITAWQIRDITAEVVPEPSSAALLSLALLGATFTRRRN